MSRIHLLRTTVVTQTKQLLAQDLTMDFCCHVQMKGYDIEKKASFGGKHNCC